MKKRHMVEGGYGWMKSVGRMRQTVFRGLDKVSWQFTLTATARNLLLIANRT